MSRPSLRGRALLTACADAPERGRIRWIDGALIEIDETGAIAAVAAPDDPAFERRRAEAHAAGKLETAPEGTVLTPGLVDLHVHAPQYPQLGDALDAPLEVWLQRYTFPLEARYADLAYAERVYAALVADLLANGSTTVVYYGSIHGPATRALADACLAAGQRALVGKTAMDDPATCPESYRDASAEASIRETADFIAAVRAHPENRDGRLLPVVTPRFIPACTDAALEGLGALAAETGAHVQTHCSESDWEDAYVFERCGMRDAEALDRFGLLRAHTILAHGGFLRDRDLDLIRARGAAVAHCPLSNVYFGGAVFPLRAALEKGVRVGLGTDISGGPSASILANAAASVTMARLLETGVDPAIPPERRGRGERARTDFRDAFFLATAGGGDAIGLPIGRIEPGARFDAILIDPEAEGGGVRAGLWETSDREARLQAIVMTATKANIARVWVDGELVSARA